MKATGDQSQRKYITGCRQSTIKKLAGYIKNRCCESANYQPNDRKPDNAFDKAVKIKILSP